MVAGYSNGHLQNICQSKYKNVQYMNINHNVEADEFKVQFVKRNIIWLQNITFTLYLIHLVMFIFYERMQGGVPFRYLWYLVLIR